MSNPSLDPTLVAIFLRDHPEFLADHPELLSSQKLSHQTGGKTVSLIERQIDLLREKNRALEFKLAGLVRNAQENEAIATKLQSFTRNLLLASNNEAVPSVVEQSLRNLFSVPQIALRLWDVDEAYQKLDCAAPVQVEIITLANSMTTVYCGPNSDFQAASWLVDGGTAARSLALIPLRVGANPDAFGLLVLGSADPSRFTTDMGTSFLDRLGELSSAALARLTPHSISRALK
jgi:uncharacterized protein